MLPYAPVMPSTAEPDVAVDADVTTIADLPFHMMGRFPKPVTIGRCRGDEIIELSSKEVFERIRDLSLGLRALGISAGDRVAIISESRPEWLLCDLAVLTAGAVTVPIYPTLSAAQVRYILQDSGARLAIVSTRLQLEKAAGGAPSASGARSGRGHGLGRAGPARPPGTGVSAAARRRRAPRACTDDGRVGRGA